MAIVTRRYLFQGPPIEDIQAATDPGLTLASAALKLAFDATFDDANATIAAVDQAMAQSGYVPDPGADTTVPPSFPGGGSSNALVYRPGSGLPGPIIFDAWADLVTELAKLRSSANGGGSYIIEFDDSIVSPAPIPVGAYDMTGVSWTGPVGRSPAITIPEGVVFTRLRHLTRNLQITFTGVTPPVADFSGPFDAFALENGAEIVCVGTGPFLRNSTTFVIVALVTGGKISTGATPAIDVDTTTPGTSIGIIGFGAGELQSNTLSGIPGSAAQLSWALSSAQLSEDQPAFAGTLGNDNQVRVRRFVTAIITADQTIEVNVVARVDTTSGPVAITLPPAFNNRGLTTIVKDVGGAAAANAITVVPTGTDTIDGGASAGISVNKGSLRFVSDGVSDWLIV